MASDFAPHDLDTEIPAAARRVRAFLAQLGAGRQDQEDILQDVMERCWRYRESFDPTGNLHAWMMKTAFRSFLDHRSRAARMPEPMGETAESVTDQVGDQVEARDEVGFVLRQLSGIEQDIVLRFHQRQESVAEIGAALGMPEGTVKSHLHRARRKMVRPEGGR